MAMTSCRECGKSISSQAAACPHCGFAKPKDKDTTAKVITLLFTVLVVGGILSTCSSDEPPKAPPDPAKEQRFREEVGALLYIKKNMKNPASFELVDFIRTPANSLCITYRGTNSFNAVITQRHVINNSINTSSAEAWQTHCAGRAGEDVSKAKYALP